MATLTPAKIKDILFKHAQWLNDEKGGERADMTDAHLTDANLRNADLRNADLRGAYLAGADLTGANLRDADLTGADLRAANLRAANLRAANLRDANLAGANLRCANLRCANLTDADLGGADLRNADLRGAYLARANLGGAKLPAFALTPEEGAFIGWKKVRGDIILKLEILADARRTSSLIGRKCRADRVRVLEAFGAEPGQTEFDSMHSPEFVYRIGDVVAEPMFDGDIRIECTSGIHFFITRAEAEAY